jgi:hypothetical protein
MQIIIFMVTKDKANDLVLSFGALQKYHHNKCYTIFESLLSVRQHFSFSV